MNKTDTHSKLSTATWMLRYMKSYWFLIMAGVVSILIIAVFDVAISYIVKKMVDYSLTEDYSKVMQIGFVLVAIILIGMVLKYVEKTSIVRFGASVMFDIKRDLVVQIERISIPFLEKNSSGDLISRLTNDTAIVQNVLSYQLTYYVYHPVVLVCSFALLLWMNWKLMLVCIIVFPLAILVSNWISKPIEKLSGTLQEDLGKVNAIAKESTAGIEIIKSFNLNQFMNEKFQKNVNQALQSNLKLEKRKAYLAPITILVQNLPFVLCIVYGGYMAANGEFAVSKLLAFVYLLNFFVNSAAALPDIIGNYFQAKGAAARIAEISSYPQENDKTPQSAEKQAEATEDLLAAAIHPLEFKQVSFSYDLQENILNRLDFVLKQNEMIAIVGPSGGGKSTIFKLLCGYYEMQEGSIQLFGNQITRLDIEELRSYISIVSQDIYLFPVSIADNIAYGKWGAGIEEIMKAAKAANAHDFIMELPGGYDTMVGERGTNLSGGQRQRISIARAILKDAPILLLDEPTASLDIHSERLIQQAIDQIMRNRTVLVAAHRISTIKNAHQVLVLDQGNIVERGTHAELLLKNGVYHQLYSHQFMNEEIEKGA